MAPGTSSFNRQMANISTVDRMFHMVYVSGDERRSCGNTNCHCSIEQVLSVKITCRCISKSTSGRHNLNKNEQLHTEKKSRDDFIVRRNNRLSTPTCSNVRSADICVLMLEL